MPWPAAVRGVGAAPPRAAALVGNPLWRRKCSCASRSVRGRRAPPRCSQVIRDPQYVGYAMRSLMSRAVARGPARPSACAESAGAAARAYVPHKRGQRSTAGPALVLKRMCYALRPGPLHGRRRAWCPPGALLSAHLPAALAARTDTPKHLPLGRSPPHPSNSPHQTTSASTTLHHSHTMLKDDGRHALAGWPIPLFTPSHRA